MINISRFCVGKNTELISKIIYPFHFHFFIRHFHIYFSDSACIVMWYRCVRKLPIQWPVKSIVTTSLSSTTHSYSRFTEPLVKLQTIHVSSSLTIRSLLIYYTLSRLAYILRDFFLYFIRHPVTRNLNYKHSQIVGAGHTLRYRRLTTAI